MDGRGVIFHAVAKDHIDHIGAVLLFLQIAQCHHERFEHEQKFIIAIELFDEPLSDFGVLGVVAMHDEFAQLLKGDHRQLFTHY